MRSLGKIALALWVAAGLVVGAALLALHLPALPTPASTDPRLLALVAHAAPDPQWRAVHVLYADCPCSARVLDHVIARGARADFRDHVVLVGAAAADLARARAAHLDVELIDEATATDRFGIESAPLLVVADPAGVLRYVGGYTDRKQSLAIHDVDLIAAVQRAEPPSILPVIGCAVSARLKGWVDPLGLKSRS